MTTQKFGTKIHTATDFEVTALVMAIDGDSRLLVACELLGKNPAAYAHLDKGRRSMTGANLLRGAARRDENFVAKVRAAVKTAAVIDGFTFDQVDVVSREDDRAVEEEISVEHSIDWPKSARFKFAQLQDDNTYKFYYNAPKTGEYTTR